MSKKTENPFKPFEKVKIGDVGIDCFGQTVIVKDKGVLTEWDRLKEYDETGDYERLLKNPEFHWENAGKIDLDQALVAVKDIHSKRHYIYSYCHAGVLVFKKQRGLKASAFLVVAVTAGLIFILGAITFGLTLVALAIGTILFSILLTIRSAVYVISRLYSFFKGKSKPA